MTRLNKNDLEQMNDDYLKSLKFERLVEVAKNLRELAISQWEKLEVNSSNSSQPPSTDSPYKRSDQSEKREQTQENQLDDNQDDNQLEEEKKESGVRFRMSRAKIQEFLHDWANTELAVGTIDRCIREAGIACVPVVEELVEQLQEAQIIHLDETHWYERGKLCWLWVAISATTAVFHIGSRRKEELSHLICETFMGWLVTDGYRAYRSYPKRQKCLAHLIRKAIAITGALNQKAAQIGEWILTDLRELMASMAEAGEKSSKLIGSLFARLNRACHLGKKADHEKLCDLAKEILNDWDAVVAFVHHPELPPTNNEAERALRHAVIARNIGYGTRTREGSLAYSSLLSVIETCRLRKLNPWTFISQAIASGRKGITPSPIPAA